MEPETTAPEAEGAPTTLEQVILHPSHQSSPVYGSDRESLQAAADEVARRREERATQMPQELIDDVNRALELQGPAPPPGVNKITYIDGRDPKTPITAEQATRDLAAYRGRVAAEILQEIGVNAQPQAEPQPEQPAGPTAEQIEAQFAEQQRIAALEQQKIQEISALQAAQKNLAQHYGAMLVDLSKTTEADFQGLNSFDDIARLADSDPQRYIRVRSALDKGQHLHQSIIASGQAQAQLARHQFAHFAQAEDAKVAEIVPELGPSASPQQQKEFQKAAMQTLHDLGFSDQELAAGWNSNPLLRDHRTQALIAEVTRLRQNQARGRDIDQHKVRSAPKVMRPGIAQPSGNGSDASRMRELARAMPSLSGRAAIDAAVEYQNLKRARG